MKYRKYDNWPKGFYFVDYSNPDNAYYISSPDVKVFKNLQSPTNMEEIPSSDTKGLQEARRACESMVEGVRGSIIMANHFLM